jgi:hypothetical protein
VGQKFKSSGTRKRQQLTILPRLHFLFTAHPKFTQHDESTNFPIPTSPLKFLQVGRATWSTFDTVYPKHIGHHKYKMCRPDTWLPGICAPLNYAILRFRPSPLPTQACSYLFHVELLRCTQLSKLLSFTWWEGKIRFRNTTLLFLRNTWWPTFSITNIPKLFCKRSSAGNNNARKTWL